MLGIVATSIHYLILTQSYMPLTITVLLQVSKQRLREVKANTQEHTPSKWQNRDLNTNLLTSGLQVHCIAQDRKNMQKEKTSR